MFGTDLPFCFWSLSRDNSHSGAAVEYAACFWALKRIYEEDDMAPGKHSNTGSIGKKCFPGPFSFNSLGDMKGRLIIFCFLCSQLNVGLTKHSDASSVSQKCFQEPFSLKVIKAG